MGKQEEWVLEEFRTEIYKRGFQWFKEIEGSLWAIILVSRKKD